MPTAPDNVAAGTITVTTIDLTWTDPNSPDVEIRAYWRVTGDSTWLLDATLAAGTVAYTFGSATALTPGTAYDIGVSAWDDPNESSIVSVSGTTIDGVSFVSGSTTLMFRPANIQSTLLFDQPLQRKMVSSQGTVRILEISPTDQRFIDVRIVVLPRADDSPFNGYDALRSFLLTTVNWAETVWTFNDNDGDSFSVRIWPQVFGLTETKFDEFGGRILLRIEA